MHRQLLDVLQERKQTLENQIAALSGKRDALRRDQQQVERDINDRSTELASIDRLSDKDRETFATLCAKVPHCPLCFVRGQRIALTALNEEDGYEPLKCPRCAETFYLEVR